MRSQSTTLGALKRKNETLFTTLKIILWSHVYVNFFRLWRATWSKFDPNLQGNSDVFDTYYPLRHKKLGVHNIFRNNFMGQYSALLSPLQNTKDFLISFLIHHLIPALMRGKIALRQNTLKFDPDLQGNSTFLAHISLRDRRKLAYTMYF